MAARMRPAVPGSELDPLHGQASCRRLGVVRTLAGVCAPRDPLLPARPDCRNRSTRPKFHLTATWRFPVLLADPIGLEAERGAVVLPLLATLILWINLFTDGPPALALGVDPADEDLMRHPPRPVGEGVLTPQMWRGIAFVGVIMAAGTLFALDISLPGGFVDGSGTLRYAQTMAFTTLMLFKIFNVVNARSDAISAFVGLFTNPWLWAAMVLSAGLQVTVVNVPVLQQAFGTVGLRAGTGYAVSPSRVRCCGSGTQHAVAPKSRATVSRPSTESPFTATDRASQRRYTSQQPWRTVVWSSRWVLHPKEPQLPAPIHACAAFSLRLVTK